MLNSKNDCSGGLAEGIAISKNAEIDLLTAKINDAQYTVDQMRAVVTSMTNKLNEFSSFLNESETNKATALINLNSVKDILSDAKHLISCSEQAQCQTEKVKTKITTVSARVALLINKLIFSVEIIDKLSQTVNNQKMIQTIPSELFTLLSKATTNANNAVATTLTALSSCYAAEATVLESNNITDIEVEHARNMKSKLVAGSMPRGVKPIESIDALTTLNKNAGIYALLEATYQQSLKKYDSLLAANDTVTSQLEFAQSQLSNATVNLNSMKAGLAATQAAVFAA